MISQKKFIETVNDDIVRFLSETASVECSALNFLKTLPCRDANIKILQIAKTNADIGLPVLFEDDLNDAVVDVSVLPKEIIEQWHVLPLLTNAGPLKIAVVDPFAIDSMDCARSVIRDNTPEFCVVPFAAFEKLFYDAFKQHETKSESTSGIVDVHQSCDSASVKQLLDDIFGHAVKARATDVHFENMRHGMRVRFRIDGSLVVKDMFNRTVANALIAKVKLLTGAKIDETRVPQDKRVRMNIFGGCFDIRVSILPTIFGENVAFRIFSNESAKLTIDDIGFSKKQLGYVEKLIGCQNGLVLLCGPTGCGKTTTLYTILKKISSPTRKIVTIEDPIEYRIDGINQVQVNDEIGLTFSSILRSVLRQSPNVIMVGEIRDCETAELAIQASLTGHLVFSTVHCKDSAGSINRLSDLGISKNLITSCFRGAISQRLFRRPCQHCLGRQNGHSAKVDVSEIDGDVPPDVGKNSCPTGCEMCSFRGYSGRTAIFDIIVSKQLLGVHGDDMTVGNDLKGEFQNICNFRDEVMIALENGKILKDDALEFFPNLCDLSS